MKFPKTVLTLVLLATTSSFALANTNPDTAANLTQIVTEAKKTQLEAKEIGNLLKVKKPDLERVNSKMQLLEQHVEAVRQLISEFESSHATLTETQKAELDRMKTTAEVLRIFVDNKKTILASGEAIQKRNTLRAKAIGIAMRAELMQQSAIKIRS
jgi:predicted component of viral defense system (DUF524 family)